MKALNLKTKCAVLATALISAAAFAAPAANAGVLVASANGCPSQTFTHPFSSWGDNNSYFLAPGGSFESGSAGWTLSGGAKVISGNEPYKVHSSADSNSLYLPAGASATSPTVCVGLDSPSLRWFQKEQSLLGLTGAMTISAYTETSLGLVVPVPVVGAGLLSPNWNPSLAGVITSSLLPLLPGQQTPVRFQFTAVTGNWNVDDVYVDPYARY